jgi:hypothetical protein
MIPPNVYDETNPSSQRMINTTAIVSSILFLPLPQPGGDLNHTPRPRRADRQLKSAAAELSVSFTGSLDSVIPAHCYFCGG